jgi:hypothetical protein
MCKQCVEAVKKHWPDLPEDDYGTLLMSATAFPMADPDYIEEQVAKLARQTRCNLDFALRIADWETSYAMANMED